MLCAVACAAVPAAAEVSLPAIIGDNMVLQRQSQATLWGWAGPGERVRVEAGWGATVATVTGPDGRWQMLIPTPPAGGPFSLRITGDDNTLALGNIMIGEVWICSGQSNMEMPVAATNRWYQGVQGAEAEIASAELPGIRFFTVENAFSAAARDDCRGAWVTCTPQTVATFSATGYFFGREIHESLGVPVGLISADWGGTVAEAWMSEAALREFPQIEPIPKGTAMHQNMPSVLFNGMIAPLIPYTIRGAIWYQGESNRSTAARYRTLFPALIDDWRRAWGQDEFPFYFVQIAPYRYGGDVGQTAELREAQFMALAAPNTGMTVTMDIGDPNDIHPSRKKEVGRRLSLWARANTYGETDLVHSGPLYRSMTIEGSAIRVRFDHVGGGLELRDLPRSHLVIAGPDKRFVVARAVVDGDSVVVSSRRVPRPVAVRYAWEAAAEPNLFNREGLPASPFRTDDWTGVLPPVTNDEAMEAYRTDESGFVALSNGRDLTGWVNVNCAPDTWQAMDGMIVCSGLPTGVLRTAGQYENFILELEWRHMKPQGNAGVFVWSDGLAARGQPFTRSIEVQVMDGRETGSYTSDGDIFPIHGSTMTPENGRGGSRGFPTEKRTNPAPLWNHYRIRCVDGAISLAVNGKVVTKGYDCSPRKGYICLESEGSLAHFRNIRIKQLPASTALGPADVAESTEGFVPLYNGIDFTGWQHGPEHEGHWKADNWRIDFDGQGTDLWTTRSYRDFVLICDWKWSGETGDSGIYLRGSSKSQVNIWCQPMGSGEVGGYRTDDKMPPEVRAGATPSVAADAPIGQWNRFVITMKGDRLTVVLNGQQVIANARLPGVPESGPIALQKHGSPIQFANLYIRELPPAQ